MSTIWLPSTQISFFSVIYTSNHITWLSHRWRMIAWGAKNCISMNWSLKKGWGPKGLVSSTYIVILITCFCVAHSESPNSFNSQNWGLFFSPFLKMTTFIIFRPFPESVRMVLPAFFLSSPCCQFSSTGWASSQNNKSIFACGGSTTYDSHQTRNTFAWRLDRHDTRSNHFHTSP